MWTGWPPTNTTLFTLLGPPILLLWCRTEGKWAETYLRLGEEQRGAQARQAAALAACAGCHSGGGCGPVLCENGECPVTYTRLACSSRLQQVEGQLARMDISG